ncbi:MAG: DUF3667 domain-containing protein [Xanthomonadaceae bacterium]|nr:DUF3667 domain-containing protein [Xanthomonadaceae bacterium]MDE1957676.1 DUF3667 domain-containing protein [Xanthomonadaceae bacterium]MDE2177588.1 DUF3667 domain-containing protein [Xanthomonadaceae bacterium]MDE2244781.1 DUF3667 domain-containing protein [Xanthomonadaceae bacterium]
MNETSPAPAACGNCGSLLKGPWCHRCGQEAHDPMQRFRGALRDLLEQVLHFDGRLWRTLLPLYFRPGFLTRDYLAGRRVRYVAPLRLMFFLAVIAFFVLRLNVETGPSQSGASDTGRYAAAHSAAGVERRHQAERARIDAALRKPNLPAPAQVLLQTARWQDDAAADRRLAELGAPVPAASGANARSGAAQASLGPRSMPTDARAAWLLGHLRTRLKAGLNDPRRWLIGVLHLLPQTMLVLLPLFALVLKGVLYGKRRLYMEHLLVALHSHAFVFLDLIVLVILDALQALARPQWPVPAAALGGVATLAGWWLLIYPLLMQKRVYGQRWGGALVAYLGIGLIYSLLLALALGAVFVLSLWSH